MAEVAVYNSEGKEIEKVKLSKKIFDITVSAGLLHEAVTSYLAQRRSANAHAKTRGEVRGGGKKPWRQKGTGRARHGSIRSPLWRGGGVTFGPRNTRNYEKKMNVKAQQKALAMALADKVSQKKFIVIDSFDSQDGKTKTLSAVIKKLPATRSALIVTSKDYTKIVRASQNMPHIQTSAPLSLNTYDVLTHDGVIVAKASLKDIEKRFTHIS